MGIDIGGTKTAVIAAREPSRILSRVEFPTRPERGPLQALNKIRASVLDILQREQHLKLQGIGVSCGGPLDRYRGIIQAPPNLTSWIDVHIKEMLEAEFGVLCHVENDANAGAMAEHRYGAGVGCSHMVFLTMGPGRGAGIIVNGEIFHGASEMAGEIGHVRLTREGPIGYGKTGSVEGWASGGGMAQHALKAVEAASKAGEQTSLAACLIAGNLTAKDIGDALEAGDAVAKRIITATGQKLGEALAILVDILNPERIVIGGLAIRLGDTLLDPAREVLRAEGLPESVEVCQVMPARLGESIGDVAALCVAMNRPSFSTEALSTSISAFPNA